MIRYPIFWILSTNVHRNSKFFKYWLRQSFNFSSLDQLLFSIMVLCKECGKKLADNNSYLIHISTIHRFLSNFSCGQQDCPRKFNTLSSLKKHTQKFHSEKNVAKNKNSESKSSSNNSFHYDNEVLYDECPELSENSPNIVETILQDTFELQMLTFVNKLYSHPAINRSVVHDIIGTTSELINNIFSNILLKIEDLPNLQGHSSYNEIISALSTDIFKSCKSEYKRFQLLAKHNLYFKPEEYFIGYLPESRTSSIASTSQVLTKQCKGVIISLRKILKKYLETPGVLQYMLDYIKNEEEVSDYMSSMFNCSLWKFIKNKMGNKTILPLYLYYDDFETGNVLGTQAGVHKLGGVYVSFACMGPEFASRLESIFLWGIFYSSDRVTFGNEAVFKVFLDELKFLETVGINVNNKQIFFVVPVFLGDNLGVNSILGFHESFSSNNFCRACFSHKNETKFMTRENKNSLRNEDNYNIHIEENSHGIKSSCMWNELSYYHVTKNLHFDIMHDLYEGICRYDFGRILKFFIKEKIFTLETLNRRIKYFNHSSVDVGNKIPLIPTTQIEKQIIIMSSAEMHAFLTYFSFIVGDLVDESDEVWHFYLLLFNIVQIVIKPSINESELIYLDNLIHEHHSLYISLFNEHLTPKFHFLLHYSRTIRNIGPLSRVSSIRFEAFHRVSKSYSNVTSSRINLPLSLGVKHQLKLAYRFLLGNGICDSIQFSETRTVPSETQVSFLKSAGFEASCLFISWLKLNGIMFKKGLIAQVDRDDFGEPVFGIIEEVFVTDDQKFYLVYKMIECYGFIKHYEAYLVEKVLPKNYIINTKSLYSPFLTHIHANAEGNKFISSVKQEM